MKKLFSILLASQLIYSSAFASVASDVELLGKLAFGTSVHSINGKTADQIFENWLEKEYGEDEERKLFFKEIEEMAFGDEVYEGFTSIRSAQLMKDFAISTLTDYIDDFEHMGDEAEADLQAAKAKVYDLDKKWAPIIKRLERQGVKFGYTGNGPGYCGISFIEMIVIDPKEQKVYEVYLSAGGEC